MSKIFLAAGSNTGEMESNIFKAIDLLKSKITDILVAPFYKTRPMYFENQHYFINTALKGYTQLSPKELLYFVKDIEKVIGRKMRFQNGPREIDIDILFYDEITYKDDLLTIAHPKIQERDFVLKPLLDLDPNFIHPQFKKTITKLYEDLPTEKYTIIGKV